METDIIRTDVDNFIKIVKLKGKITVSEAAKLLNINEKTIQSWTDFLVEEQILGTEYKFTTQYVYINEDKTTNKYYNEDNNEDNIKKKFFDKARAKLISETNIKLLWNKYLNENKYKIKDTFVKKCKEKLIVDNKIEELWKKYYDMLIEE
jgi:phage antirepressor YoqD-like protein